MAVGVPDGFDQVLALRAVIALGLRCDARREMPLDSIALTTSGDLAASPDHRPPEDSRSDGLGRFGFNLARRPLAASVRGGFDRGCSHVGLMVRP
jgi:hypothetical protein